MSPRNVILVAIAYAGLAVAPPLLGNENYINVKSVFQASQPREAMVPSRQGTKSREERTSSRLESLSTLVAGNRELIVYGGIASFGILMMGLAIGNVSSNSKSKTAEQLELLRQEKEKAENLAKLKSEFLNQVSHELRTPLAVIIGYIECITDGLYGEIETKHHEILQVVAKQSTHLKNMIDQILIYSRLEAGKQPVRIEDLQLAKIVSELRETFEFLCRQKGIDLYWELPKDPLLVRSDSVRLKEVVSNLLQNAVKYTDRGSITVRVAPLPSTDSVTVEVKDTGMGISEHHLTSIFEPFMQAHKTSSENSRGGIGLGLSIVKKHLEQLKGTIDVESELDKGSTFRVILPRNYEKQKSRTSQLLRLLRRNPIHPELPSLKLSAETRRRKSANTSHAVG
jgi:signal transduction histidine kinase